MKFQVNIDIDVPRWVRNAALVLTPVAIVLATTAIVRASVPNVFNDGDTLSAQTMNDNFDALDARIKALEDKQTITVVEQISVPPAAKWYAECTGTSGTFPQGACERMAWEACKVASYRGGWFEGDLLGGNVGIACIK